MTNMWEFPEDDHASVRPFLNNLEVGITSHGT